MEIEGFSEIISVLTLAKELHNIDRYDVVEKQFFDILSWDTAFENMMSVIMSVCSGFYSKYDDNGTEIMIFEDDVISRYFMLAWEYGKRNKIPYTENPFVQQAEQEARRWLYFSYSLEWKLLGYTKTRKAARKSKLIVYTCAYEFCEHDHLAYGLIRLYKWFSDKCGELKESEKMGRDGKDETGKEEAGKEVMVA